MGAYPLHQVDVVHQMPFSFALSAAFRSFYDGINNIFIVAPGFYVTLINIVLSRYLTGLEVEAALGKHFTI